MDNYTIIPSKLKYKSSPSIDQELSIEINGKQQLIEEYQRLNTISLAQVFDDERQESTTVRPTFKVSYVYSNLFTGTTNYLPFQYNLYYIQPELSSYSGTWKGFPQYYEFDFFRPGIPDGHVDYKSKSAYTYNWMYYLTYPYTNDYDRSLYYSISGVTQNWTVSNGIPFVINNQIDDGFGMIQFQCVASHGLTVGEYVELSISYGETNLFQVSSLGNGMFGSEIYVFGVFNLGYTGSTFSNGTKGTFKRVINDKDLETTSKYYIRQHKVLTNINGLIMTRDGFERNVFGEQRQFEYSSITPNKLSRISQKTSSNTYNVTNNVDLDIKGLVDNQMRPISEIYLTIINRGYSGYFNNPTTGGLKQGWGFNITQTPNFWWQDTNINSNTNYPTGSYVKTSGTTQTFYYNEELPIGYTVDGDFCEWNDYEQIERVVSPYFQKIKYNQSVFQTESGQNVSNSNGYYYQPHNKMTLRVFSDYIETGDANTIDLNPSYSFYSSSDEQFRWRDLYTYGFIDNLGRGVDYPFLNGVHYPYQDIIFKLIPEGYDYNKSLLGTNADIKPLIDQSE